MSDERRVPDQVPTLGERVESCRHNAEVADWQVRAVQKRLAGLEIGSPLRMQALVQLATHKAEFEHWSNYLLYYRLRAANEGEHVRPKIKLGKVANLAPPPPKWNPPREEIDDADIPF